MAREKRIGSRRFTGSLEKLPREYLVTLENIPPIAADKRGIIRATRKGRGNACNVFRGVLLGEEGK